MNVAPCGRDRMGSRYPVRARRRNAGSASAARTCWIALVQQASILDVSGNGLGGSGDQLTLGQCGLVVQLLQLSCSATGVRLRAFACSCSNRSSSVWYVRQLCDLLMDRDAARVRVDGEPVGVGDPAVRSRTIRTSTLPSGSSDPVPGRCLTARSPCTVPRRSRLSRGPPGLGSRARRVTATGASHHRLLLHPPCGELWRCGSARMPGGESARAGEQRAAVSLAMPASRWEGVSRAGNGWCLGP